MTSTRTLLFKYAAAISIIVELNFAVALVKADTK